MQNDIVRHSFFKLLMLGFLLTSVVACNTQNPQEQLYYKNLQNALGPNDQPVQTSYLKAKKNDDSGETTTGTHNIGHSNIAAHSLIAHETAMNQAIQLLYFLSVDSKIAPPRRVQGFIVENRSRISLIDKITDAMMFGLIQGSRELQLNAYETIKKTANEMDTDVGFQNKAQLLPTGSSPEVVEAFKVLKNIKKDSDYLNVLIPVTLRMTTNLTDPSAVKRDIQMFATPQIEENQFKGFILRDIDHGTALGKLKIQWDIKNPLVPDKNIMFIYLKSVELQTFVERFIIQKMRDLGPDDLPI